MPRFDQRRVQLVGLLAHGFAAVVAHRAQHDFERRNRLRPDDALVVEILFDRRAQNTRDADAVAAHFHRLRLAGFVEAGRVHRFRVLRAELEHVADFDTAADLDHALAVRRRIALLHVADIGDDRLRQIAAPVHAGSVEIDLVRADHEVAHVRDRAVRDDLDRLLRVDRPR